MPSVLNICRQMLPKMLSLPLPVSLDNLHRTAIATEHEVCTRKMFLFAVAFCECAWFTEVFTLLHWNNHCYKNNWGL